MGEGKTEGGRKMDERNKEGRLREREWVGGGRREREEGKTSERRFDHQECSNYHTCYVNFTCLLIINFIAVRTQLLNLQILF